MFICQQLYDEEFCKNQIKSSGKERDLSGPSESQGGDAGIEIYGHELDFKIKEMDI